MFVAVIEQQSIIRLDAMNTIDIQLCKNDPVMCLLLLTNNEMDMQQTIRGLEWHCKL